MKELNGKESLKQLPFADVALKFDTALDVLTERSRQAYVANISEALTLLNTDHPQYPAIKEYLTERKDNVNAHMEPGGFSFSQEDLNNLYSYFSHTTFYDITRHFVKDVFPKFFTKNPTRNPASMCLGYLLDLAKIVDPEVASIDESISVMIDAMRENRAYTDPFILGCMVDDMLHLRGTPDMPFEFLMNKDEVETFRASFMLHALPGEKLEFERGIQFKPSDILTKKTGFSQS